MITPSRWFAGGKGLDDYRGNMLSDNKLSKMIDYVSSRDLFPSVDIAGGVMYFLWDNSFMGDCIYSSTRVGKTSTCKRKLNEFDIFIRNNEALSIIHKVLSYKERKFSETVSTRKPFGFNTLYRGNDTKNDNDLTILTSVGYKYVPRKECVVNEDWIDKYKVIFNAAAPGGGSSDKNGMYLLLSSLQILNPSVICNETYLVSSVFSTEKEAKNCFTYLCGRFSRFLLLQTLAGQHITKEKFQFVPLQDFTESWTDEKLYKKYNLTTDEIAYIESLIKPM